MLLDSAAALAGITLGQLAERHGIPTPPDQRRDKGWTGQLLEAALGAQAGSRPAPDFPALGVELKSLPINALGRPRESTFVCVAAMDGRRQSWESSLVRAKLSCVLWVPVEADAAIPLAARHVGSAFLWRPSPGEEARLRADWEEITEMITVGNLDQVSSRHGRWLQLRPKAANARARTAGFDADGHPGTTLPRGFYLRTRFTTHLLARAGGLP